MAGLSKPFCLDNTGHWPGPRSLATTNGVSVDVLSSGYLDVSVPRVCLIKLCIYLIIPFTDIQKMHTRSSFGASPHPFPTAPSIHTTGGWEGVRAGADYFARSAQS